MSPRRWAQNVSMRYVLFNNNIHIKPANMRTIEMDVLESAQQLATAPKTEKLAGRVASSPGATRGIGAAIARSLAAQGATAAVGYSRDISFGASTAAWTREAATPTRRR